MHCSERNRLLCSIVSIGLALISASPAHAGLGDLVKKAKEKATRAVPGSEPAGSEKPCPPVEFDKVVLELTSPRIEAILAAFAAAGEAGKGRSELVARLNQVKEEHEAMFQKHWEKIQATRVKRSDIEVCYHDGYQAAASRKMEEYARRAMSDPALMAKYAKVAAETNQNASLSDSAKRARVTLAGMEEMMPSKEDSAAVRKACGPLPPKSAEEARFEALEEEDRKLVEGIAKIDEKIWQTQAKQSGMDSQQWAMALERIHLFLIETGGARGMKGKVAICGFSKQEEAALGSHREALAAALGFR